MQFRNFQSFGYARDPTLIPGASSSIGAGVAGTGYVGDIGKAMEWEGNKLPAYSRGHYIRQARKAQCAKKTSERFSGGPGRRRHI